MACLIERHRMLLRDNLEFQESSASKKLPARSSNSGLCRVSRVSFLWIPALLFSVSILQVQYASEARGYGTLCFFVIAAHYLQSTGQSRAKTKSPDKKTNSAVVFRATERIVPEDLLTNITYSVCCCFGFLSHAGFLQYWIPAALMAAKGFRPRPWLFQILIPGLFFLTLWSVNLRDMQSGGGTVREYISVLSETMSIVAGSPAGQKSPEWNAVLMLLIFLPAIVHLYRSCRPDFLILMGSAVIVPALLLIIMARADIYPRYFLVGTLFLYLALSDWISELCFRGSSSGSRWPLISGLGCLCVVVAGNLRLDEQLLTAQRSHYREALQRIAAETAQTEQSSRHLHLNSAPDAGRTTMNDSQGRASENRSSILVGVDHPFRHTMMLAYYLQGSVLHGRLFPSVNPADQTEWLFRHDILHTGQAQQSITQPNGQHFTLVAKYPSSVLSGWDLLIYRRSDHVR